MMRWPRLGRRARIHAEASTWIIRMGGPDAADLDDELTAWRALSKDHEAEYQDAAWMMQRASGAARTPDTSGAGSRPSRPAGRDGHPWILAVAAAVLVGVGSAVLVERHQDLQPAPVRIASTAATRIVSLRDGTRVTLGRDSLIDVHFDGSVRAITLVTGEARFAVAHDAAHPFVVTASDRQVTARGTEFAVGLHGDQVSVLMFEGVVEVAHIASGAQAALLPAVRLVRGQRLVTAGARDLLSRPVAADGGRPSRGAGGKADLANPPGAGTKAAMIRTYDATPLASVLADANQGAAKPIRLGALGLSGLHVEGRFEIGDTRALAMTLAAALDLKLEDDGRNWVLTRA